MKKRLLIRCREPENFIAATKRKKHKVDEGEGERDEKQERESERKREEATERKRGEATERERENGKVVTTMNILWQFCLCAVVAVQWWLETYK